MKQYFSIDIGGTAIKYGIITEEAVVQNRKELPTEAHQGGAAIVRKVSALVAEAVAAQPIHGICISTAGMVDPIKGEIIYAAPLIPQYIGVNWKQVIEQQFHLPCEVENDVNCAGLAEYISGAGKGFSSMLMLTIGTGIGGCMIENGSILHGCCNSACEVGYMRMRGSDFQTLGAASTLTAKVAAWKNEPVSEWNGKRIFAQAKQGDALCYRAIEEMVSVLGEGIANLCYVLNPAVVVLGGGVMEEKAYLCERIEAAVQPYLLGWIVSHTQITFAQHQNDAGMLGAFYHFLQQQRRK